MNSEHKARIAASFGAVSDGYATAAGLQRLVAGRLAGRIVGLPPRPKVLEVGCGTGFLTQALHQSVVGGRWVVSDIAPPMVANCRRKLGEPRDILFLAMDAERPALAGGFDLICASLVFQWFDDLKVGLRRLTGLLGPGGRLAFSTLTAGTLEEWRQAHRALGLSPATPAYPDVNLFSSVLGDGVMEEEEIVQTYESAHAFVATLKAIGAHTPAPGRRPLSAGTFRRVLRQLDSDGAAAITYKVAYGIYNRGLL